MYNWLDQEKIFIEAIEKIVIPNGRLDNVEFISPKNVVDLNTIPNEGGCYWIWTNEPVNHSLHKNESPRGFCGGELIYNGIAKDNVRGRAEHHLFGKPNAGWSGISLDIYTQNNTHSHRKKACAKTGKVPYIKENLIVSRANKKKGLSKGNNIERFKPIKCIKDLLNLNLSLDESDFINKSTQNDFYFRNGININDNKHKDFEFRLYYITGLKSLYLDFIEKKWREENGLPKLCSYSSGR